MRRWGAKEMRRGGVAAAVLAAVAAMLSAGAQPHASQGAQVLVFQGVQPHLAKLGDRVFLTYGQDNVISVASSTDGGQTFGPAVKLTVPGRVSLGMHRGPRIAVTPSAVMVTMVAGSKGGGLDGDVLLYRSTDGGTTFAAPVVINDVPGSAREGLHAFTATPPGRAMLAWLDLRDKGTRIYTALSRDHGATWSTDYLVYASPSGSVCECCHPSVAIDTNATTAVMFRNNLDGNRDFYVAQSRDGAVFDPAQKSGVGSWRLDACPMDGGGMVFRNGSVISVWRRENDIYLATLGKPEARVGAGRDPVIDRFGAHQDIAWSSPTGMVLMPEGGRPTTLGEGRFPAIVSLAQRTVLAWEFQGMVRILSVAR